MQHEEFLQAYLPTKKQRLAVNVGAASGHWVELFSPLFDRVIAVEANPTAADQIRSRKLSNVQILDGAGWICSRQMMPFHVRNELPNQSALACRDPNRTDGVSETIDVPTVAIDDLNLDACDLIWVDVEGAEVMVIQGATRTIERHKPQLIIECHEVEHRAWLEVWLRRCGYNLAVVHNPHHDLTDSRFDRNTHLIGHHWRYRGTW